MPPAKEQRSNREFLKRVWRLVTGPSIEPTGAKPQVPKNDLANSVRRETMQTMVENLRTLVAYEEQRVNSLSSRGFSVAGFSGLATAVLASTGSNANLPLSSKILFVLALVGLVFTTAGVVLGMAATRSTTIQSTRQLELYRDVRSQSVPPERINVQVVDILIDRLDGLRDQNQARATWLNRCALALVLSVLLAGAGAVITFFA